MRTPGSRHVPRAGMVMQIALSSLWLVLVAWLILRAFRQRDALPRIRPEAVPDGAPGVQDAPGVAIIIPARNEEHNIAPCVESLLAQRYPPTHLRIIVVDDESADHTAAIVGSLAKRSEQIVLVHSSPLPAGWKGKVHACWMGAQARPAHAEWLCFIDADMRAQPQLIASAVIAAIQGEIDLLSLAPRHQLLSLAERLILPCGMYLLGFSQDLTRIQAADSSSVVATGQFMLVRREAYERAGGHAAVRSEICEDVELARLLKRRGGRVLLKDGSHLLATRMYTGWRTLWPGIAKNLSDMLGGAARTLATVLIALVMSWATVLLPLFDAVGCQDGHTGSCIALLPAVLGSSALIALHLAGAVHFGIPLWYGVLFPVGYTAGALIALDSVRWHLTGRITWKGRTYQ